MNFTLNMPDKKLTAVEHVEIFSLEYFAVHHWFCIDSVFNAGIYHFPTENWGKKYAVEYTGLKVVPFEITRPPSSAIERDARLPRARTRSRDSHFLS